MDLNTYFSIYDITFPPSKAARSPAEGILKVPYTVTLTTKALDDYERGQVTARYRTRLRKVEQEISDIGQLMITNRLLWRCAALACLQVHQELFSLQNVGFMLMANGVQISTEIVHLHELLETFMAMQTKFPGLETYYQLPDMLDDQQQGASEEQPSIALMPEHSVSIRPLPMIGTESWNRKIG